MCVLLSEKNQYTLIEQSLSRYTLIEQSTFIMDSWPDILNYSNFGLYQLI